MLDAKYKAGGLGFGTCLPAGKFDIWNLRPKAAKSI
jgi:hypothetical protein